MKKIIVLLLILFTIGCSYNQSIKLPSKLPEFEQKTISVVSVSENTSGELEIIVRFKRIWGAFFAISGEDLDILYKRMYMTPGSVEEHKKIGNYWEDDHIEINETVDKEKWQVYKIICNHPNLKSNKQFKILMRHGTMDRTFLFEIKPLNRKVDFSFKGYDGDFSQQYKY